LNLKDVTSVAHPRRAVSNLFAGRSSETWFPAKL
jgi:hypothetical protein